MERAVVFHSIKGPHRGVFAGCVGAQGKVSEPTAWDAAECLSRGAAEDAF